MYDIREQILRKIGQENADKIKNFLVNSINCPNNPNICDDKDKLIEDMYGAFWEDVCIAADLEKSVIFIHNPDAEEVDEEIDLLYDDNEVTKHNLLIDTKSDAVRVAKKYICLKKKMPSELWKRLSPFFLYIAAEEDLFDLYDFRLEKFEAYNYIYSLGLLIGKNSDNEGGTITKVLLKELMRKKRILKNKENTFEKYDDCLKKAKKDVYERMKLAGVFGWSENYFMDLIESIILLEKEGIKSTNEIINEDDIEKNIRDKIAGLTIRKEDIYKIMDVIILELIYEELCSKSVSINDVYHYYCLLRQKKKDVSELEDGYSIAVRFIYKYAVEKMMSYYKDLESNDQKLASKDDVSEMVEAMYDFYGDKALGSAITESRNFNYMKMLMENKEREVNKGFVVYCFNLVTDWFNYILYLKKKDFNIAEYKGLALKQVACDYMCIENVPEFIAYDFTNGFWKQAEDLRQEMVTKIKGEWDDGEYIYKRYDELYKDIVDFKVKKGAAPANRSILGTYRDFFEYWMRRFENNCEKSFEEETESEYMVL